MAAPGATRHRVRLGLACLCSSDERLVNKITALDYPVPTSGTWGLIYAEN